MFVILLQYRRSIFIDWDSYIASMCLVRGGGGFHVLSQSVFEYISGRDVADSIALPEEVSDLEARSIIDKVRHD